MDGLLAESLIDYWELTGDARVPAAIKNMLDWIWENGWNQETNQLKYWPTDVHPYYITEDINLLAPAFAWYWSITRGSYVFPSRRYNVRTRARYSNRLRCQDL